MTNHTALSWQQINAAKPVFDLHIHPAMSRLVIKQNLNRRFVVSRSFNPFAVRASWPTLKAGGYGAILSVIHVPERGLLEDFPVIKWFRILRPDLWKTLVEVPYINATLNIMDDLENSVQASDEVQLAKSVSELDAILRQPIEQRRTAVVHVVEGAHSLGGPHDTEADIFRNLDTLYQRGVAYLTLAAGRLGPIADRDICQRGEPWKDLVDPFQLLDVPYLQAIRAS